MIQSFYVNRIVYFTGLGAAALFVLAYFLPPLFVIAVAVLLLLAIAILMDTILLYAKRGVYALRSMEDRFSNGDENKVQIQIENDYPFSISCTIIDELPFQFQERNWNHQLTILTYSKTTFTYLLKPLQRGEYAFGNINLYVSSPLRFVSRRYTIVQPQVVKVYPSYVQMRRYQILAAANRLQEVGVKRLRKLGHSLEFEQIKEYVPGDDYRTINWKATARHANLMVNNFTDERSQQIY
ncbi:MAG: DUF58 domain-containing protein, partial [Flavisolibacter sp.]|nr:DUF58 domain-containing protein [Flavisolibacter sp.]